MNSYIFQELGLGRRKDWDESQKDNSSVRKTKPNKKMYENKVWIEVIIRGQILLYYFKLYDLLPYGWSIIKTYLLISKSEVVKMSTCDPKTFMWYYIKQSTNLPPGGGHAATLGDQQAVNSKKAELEIL